MPEIFLAFICPLQGIRHIAGNGWRIFLYKMTSPVGSKKESCETIDLIWFNSIVELKFNSIQQFRSKRNPPFFINWQKIMFKNANTTKKMITRIGRLPKFPSLRMMWTDPLINMLQNTLITLW